MRVLDAPPDDSEDREHSNVIPVLPVGSRDTLKTGRISLRRRREVERSQRSLGRSQMSREGGDDNAVVRDNDKDNADVAAAAAAAATAILVSNYVTGLYVTRFLARV